ncbi:cell envelope integrity EipB family protein [Xanthobacter dioxanivorans]|uniref:Cell envelope integrity EipB family protein n=1 Tax=Xanthobacter dioxanivorans TaxID=2528964 RepID=A0A974PKD1_9HYPH|nr:cell envelope integrity EipB family protein [Xanthobacter dioxanivorans]QRG05202.1 cell envelope integrity EipB family protein [Xanthobacter dioxanivorans]
MRFSLRLTAAATLGLWCLGAAPASAVGLLPHRASYRLSLDTSKPSGQLEDMSGRIDYEITGDACGGYNTLTRQESVASTGEGDPQKQATTSKAWEDGEAKSYRFLSTSDDAGDPESRTEASVVRQGQDALKVTVTKPKGETLELKGEILLPTEHVMRVLKVAAEGERVFQAKVYEGTSDPGKVFDTLTVIGAPSTDETRLAAPARATLSGRTFYPVTVSYYDEGATGRAPSYVMAFSLYDNGVVGSLKIDYGRFALVGAMSAFEALKPSEACAK